MRRRRPAPRASDLLGWNLPVIVRRGLRQQRLLSGSRGAPPGVLQVHRLVRAAEGDHYHALPACAAAQSATGEQQSGSARPQGPGHVVAAAHGAICAGWSSRPTASVWPLNGARAAAARDPRKAELPLRIADSGSVHSKQGSASSKAGWSTAGRYRRARSASSLPGVRPERAAGLPRVAPSALVPASRGCQRPAAPATAGYRATHAELGRPRARGPAGGDKEEPRCFQPGRAE